MKNKKLMKESEALFEFKLALVRKRLQEHFFKTWGCMPFTEKSQKLAEDESLGSATADHEMRLDGQMDLIEQLLEEK